MTKLVEDPSELGLWRAAPIATPGVHAIIIGVSDYPHLIGGARHNETPEAYGMGQLFVSAKTAASVFDWLRSQGKFAGQEIASCRLLLAPSPGEQSFVDGLVGRNYARPEFATLRGAIENWSKEFLRAPTAEAKRNVSVFFFSGHGLEHAASPSLLARDFLEPIGEAGVHHAIAFVPMRDALKTYNVNHCFYFLDACRNVPAGLMGKDPVGASFLRPQTTYAIAPTSVMWLTATSTGRFAYQPNSSAAPATYFGQSLLEGLAGVPPELKPYDVAKSPFELSFEALEDYAKERTRELVRDIDPGLDQPVKASGDPHEDDTILATLPGHGAGPPPPPPPNLPPTPPFDLPPFTPGGVSVTDLARVAARATRFRENLSAPVDIGRQLKDIDFNSPRMHEGFGHEWISDLWARTASFAIVGPHHWGPVSPMLGRIQTTDAEHVVSSIVDLLIPERGPDAAVWIGLGDGQTNRPRMGVLIPGDLGPTPIRLALTFTRQDGYGALTSVSARVGPPTLLDGADEELVRIWTGIWETQRRETFASLGKALSTIDLLGKSEFALFEKSRSPAAAAIGAATLLRAGQFDRLRDWPRNLANWFNSPDGAVIWAETRFRSDDKTSRAEALHYFNKIEDYGPPRIKSVLDVAVQRLSNLEAGVSPATRTILEYAASSSRPEGLFASFGPLDPQFHVEFLFGGAAFTEPYMQEAASDAFDDHGE